MKFMILATLAAASLGSVSARAQVDLRMPVYHGQVAKPVLRPADREYRTRIRQAFAGGVNFAGHYIVIEIGCGMGCTLVYLGDAKTGRIQDVPLGGEDFFGLLLSYRKVSGDVLARWANDYKDENCHEQVYRFTGTSFVRVGQQRTLSGECPR